MRIADAARDLELRLREQGADLASLDAPSAVLAMTDFYDSSRCEDAAGLDEDGDALLVQWGLFDFERTGPTFQFDLTRQFIEAGEDGQMWQMHLTLHFEPDDQLEAVSPGDRWCFGPGALPEFVAFINDSPALAAIAGRSAAHVELCLDPV